MINKAITTALTLAAALSISALPAHADGPIEALDWNQLPAETRETLAPVEKRWDKLKPQQQHKLVRRAQDKNFKNRAERWKKLSPEERKQIIKARKRFKDMPPEKRKELRKRWENMTEEEKRQAKERRLKKREMDKKKDRQPDKGKPKEK